MSWPTRYGWDRGASPAAREPGRGFRAPLAIGRDASQIAALSRELQQTTHNFGRTGQTLFAISGLDIALWDLAGKVAGLPLAHLLGGAMDARLPLLNDA